MYLSHFNKRSYSGWDKKASKESLSYFEQGFVAAVVFPLNISVGLQHLVCEFDTYFLNIINRVPIPAIPSALLRGRNFLTVANTDEETDLHHPQLLRNEL